jgi:hypothetical protein
MLMEDNAASSNPLYLNYDWRQLYIAALFENDKRKLAEKIAIAQQAVGTRRQELFASGGDTRERQVLDNALFSLHALASVLAVTPRLNIIPSQDANARVA